MAAGDITSAMVTQLGTLLDESTASYFSTAERYTALDHGQRELIAIFLGRYKAEKAGLPNVLRPLLKAANSATLTASTSTITLPTGFLHCFSFKYDYDNSDSSGLIPCIIRDPGGLYHTQKNVYLSSSAAAPVIWIDAANINLETPVVAAPSETAKGSYYIEYLGAPTTIGASSDPVLPESCYNAILTYAYAELLHKDQRTQEGDLQFARFYQMAQALYA